ncbi:hypothetical protein BH11PAT4_BH11PAT4_3940 [soil metagenome]
MDSKKSLSLQSLIKSPYGSPAFFLLIAVGCAFWLGATSSLPSDTTGCPEGYIAIPDEDFCVMRYEAQHGSNNLPMSKPGVFPWNFQSPVGAKDACEDLGSSYHLMTSDEWMAVANNILSTPLNDLSAEAGVQLAVGNSAGAKQVQAVPAVSVSTASCTLSESVSSDANKNCPLRGSVPYTGTAGSWNVPYVSGQPSRSLSRTLSLSNGEVIWDFTGNLWEWMADSYVFEDKTGTGETFEVDSDGLTGNGIHATFPITKTRWIEYNEVAAYGNLAASKPLDPTLTSANGIGKISLNPGWSWDDASGYTTPFKAVGRGGAWANNENSGIYSVDLALGPSYSRNYTGFRCVKSL